MIKLSPGVFLYPAGSAAPQVAAGAVVLAHVPGDPAFGDGSHPTTRLCAGVVDFICRQERPESVLDIGTGTGILARIARARGATYIVGTDIDPRALRSAENHSQFDHHPIVIQLCDASPDSFGSPFDLVVANILEGVLHTLAPALTRALAPQGALLLSGFTRLQTPALRVVFTRLGLQFVTESHLEEWALLMFRKPRTVD